MIEIILARHGETEWNKGEIFRGRAEVGLNETGLRQAALLAECLGQEKIDIIYSSPLQRAVKTAEAIASRHGLKVSAVENLIDFDYGEWQGMTHPEVKEKYAGLYRDWLDTPERVKMPGGESLKNVRERVVPFVKDTAAGCGEGKIVFVSHRVVLKVLICALLGLGDSCFWNIRMDTAALTRFTFNGNKAVLASHNDTCHLKSCMMEKLNDF
ncbi:MAG: hypothetical protein A2137_03635 [Chloroflexi bacterium RBG_16_58_8]|nr:MAG: hypothetical protein A2137_03635 [Chloroflexi bacterium RBG_16_58_8]